MKYQNGADLALGDIVRVPVPGGYELGRVVMLGDSYDHLDIDPEFIRWVMDQQVLRKGAIVVEWVGKNPFEHGDPQYSPVGNFMFTDVDEWIVKES